MAGEQQVTARGPGRVNLIGEHTDYNDGLCLPFAIERGVTVHGEATGGGDIEAEAVEYGETDVFPAADPPREGADSWRAFVRGAVAELRARGVDVPGARLRIEADLPDGVGLSSSAALESALCLALLALAGAPEGDRVELAKLCSRIEHDWVGAETGLLDQLASLFGREGAAVRLDVRTLELDPVPLELGGFRLATIDSGSVHTHAGSGYNARRAECREAMEQLGLSSLRDAGPDDVARLPEPLNRRVRHVVTENARVDATVAALRLGDLDEVGRLLDASHASLRDDYEASVPEVEATVDRVRAGGAVGARMVGGGFGGSVLALFGPGADLPEGAFEVRPGPAARLL
jgi:galactokinase